MTTPTDIIPQNAENMSENATISQEIQKYLPGAKPLLLRGNFNNNTDYSKAKAPMSKGWGKKDFATYKPPTDTDIKLHLHNFGWIGAALSGAHCVVDVDPLQDFDKKEITSGHEIGGMLYQLLKDKGYSFHAITTPRGMQFIFKKPQQSKIKNDTKAITKLGVVVDYRTDGGQIVWPLTVETPNRFFTHKSDRELDEVPSFLQPFVMRVFTKEKEPKFPLFPFGEGSRNNDMNNFLFSVRRESNGTIEKEELKTIAHYVNDYFVNPPLEKSEIDATINSVMSATIKPSTGGTGGEDFSITVDGPSSVKIPTPYSVNKGTLWKKEIKKIDGIAQEVSKMVCRHAPIVTRSFTNVERSQLYYEIEWTDHGRVYKETVTAGSLATKKDLLKLADMSLGVNDLNAKDLIDYFDKYVTQNNIQRDHLVERLGHIKNGFIHPLNSEGVEILPADIGEKQILEAFEVSGTTDEWISEVFDKVRNHPKATLLVLASFTSVILNDLKLKPFIVDLSGVTSQGKTTALRVAGSVWGNEYLVSEWNLTKVAAERKAAFLNSFPLLLDDTRKADEKHLQAFVYNFSGGRSKGRGSVGGSQQEYTWNNLMLSTGETPLNAYGEDKGGVAARILPITGLPFEGENYRFFNDMYKALEKNYGAIGLDFLQHWSDKKKVLLPYYEEFNDLFQKKARGNDVVARIARYYAAIAFTGKLLNDFFDIGIDIRSLSDLFDEINAENKSTDKPMQLLEMLLTDLDSKRDCISGKHAVHRDLKAIYKDGTLYLLPSYLKEFLKLEQSAIRSEWLRREITVGSTRNGKETDSRLLKHLNSTHRVVPIRPEIIAKLGFEFSEE